VAVFNEKHQVKVMIQIKKHSMPYKINAILLHVIPLPKEREKSAKFRFFYLEISDSLLPW
jgi:hypothetical protein